MNTMIERSVAAAPPERRLSTNAVRSGTIGQMLGWQIRAEFMKLWRIPMFSVPTLLFPVLLFLLFGAPNVNETLPDGTPLGGYMLASFAAYGLLGVAFFSFGIGVASERDQGWTRYVRVTPVPAWVFFAGKIVVALLFAAMLLVVLFGVGAFGVGVRLPLQQWSMLFVSLVLGVLPLMTAGFALGYWAGPNSAAPIANLIYLPIAYASGFLMPVYALPEIVQRVTPYLPPYHYGQIAWRAIGVDDGQFGWHVLYLLGTALVFGALAIWGYWRDEGKQFG